MKLVKSIQVMSTVTVFALIYTHLQMQIFDYAYQGKTREKEIVTLKSENGRVTYNIMQLKSSLNLGVTLLTDNSIFQFSDDENIVQLVTTESLNAEHEGTVSRNEGPIKPLLSFLSFKSEAEARSFDKSRILRSWRKEP
ncbi:MAG TPA: hypothetical protein PLB05_10615 [Candidatus Omnitrophota bacterium]|jgi:hypothetical protein|nr:hypothetical protein [Candidatus Omnitrophota bacterium]HPN56110.1 hypothetical protein [Candidatus Omnitrophota bacterium]